MGEGKIRAFYNFGEDPLQTKPDTAQVRRMLESLDLLISQDIFMTQTTALAESMGLSWDHISPWCWWITMNMMYSDYGSVAIHYGVSTAEFFAELAQAFLFDKDGPGPKAKLAAYYHGIVKAGEQG